jgi:hypothetical protein
MPGDVLAFYVAVGVMGLAVAAPIIVFIVWLFLRGKEKTDEG